MMPSIPPRGDDEPNERKRSAPGGAQEPLDGREVEEDDEPELEPSAGPEDRADDLVTVATFRFAHEAEFGKLRLEAAGVTAFIADAETVAMDWLLGNAIGNIKLQVPRSRAEEAATILAEAPERERTDEGEDEDDTGAT